MTNVTDLIEDIQDLVTDLQSLGTDLTDTAGLSVVGVAGSSNAPVDAITASGNGEVLQVIGGEIVWAPLAGGSIPNDTISNAMLRNSSALSVIGRSANSVGDPADIVAGTNDRLLRQTSNTLNWGQLTAGMFPSTVVPDAALSSNVPLLNGTNTFTNTVSSTGSVTGFLAASTSACEYRLDVTNATTNQRLSALRADGDEIALVTRDDAGTLGNKGLVLFRSGTTVTDVQLNATSLDFNGTADFSSNVTIQGTLLGQTAQLAGSQALRLHTEASIDVGGQTAKLQVMGTSNATGSISAVRFNNSSGGARLILGASRSGTVGGFEVLQDGDTVGRVDFAASDGTDLASIAGQILVAIDGTPGSNDVPGEMIFSTTADGASAPTARLTIGANGQFTTSNSAGFTIGGTGETLATFIDDGAVTLYYDNAAKVATTTNGIDVTGSLSASGQVLVGSAASDPTALGNGSIYYNTATHKFRGRANGAWVDLH